VFIATGSASRGDPIHEAGAQLDVSCERCFSSNATAQAPVDRACAMAMSAGSLRLRFIW
jgi:hypothetical protein